MVMHMHCHCQSYVKEIVFLLEQGEERLIEETPGREAPGTGLRLPQPRPDQAAHLQLQPVRTYQREVERQREMVLKADPDSNDQPNAETSHPDSVNDDAE
jgi:hypothetical protein